MSLPELPTELLLLVAANIRRDRDMSALARTNHRLYGILDRVLYRHNLQYSGGSVMRWAMQQDRWTTAQKMLEYGADISRYMPIDDVAVYLAADNGREDILRFLLTNAQTSRQMNNVILVNALGSAVMRADHGCIRLLFEYNFNPWNTLRAEECIPIAARQGDLATLELVLHLSRPQPRQEQIMFSCVIAIKDGYDEKFDVLLAASTMPAKHNNLHALVVATQHYDRVDLLRRVIQEKGLDPNYKPGDYDQALAAACRHGQEAIVRFLLSLENIDCTIKGAPGLSLLSLAAHHGHISILQLLLEDGRIDINEAGGHNISPGTIIPDGCLNAGALVNTGGCINRTALMGAARYGHEPIVRLLLAQPGINVGAVDHYGDTALTLATAQGHETIRALLLEHTPRNDT